MINICIVIFVYRRLDKVNRLVTSLKRCPESQQSELLIFSDYSADKVVRTEVESVRRFVSDIDGFKSVRTIYRDVNYGVEKNEIEGITEALQSYEAVIVLEDDLEVAPDFLSYMYKALEKYKKNTIVSSVIGYSYFGLAKSNKLTKRIEKLPDYGFVEQCCSWGWGTWKDRWEIMKNPITGLDVQKLYEGKFRHRFDCNYFFSDMLVRMYKDDQVTWDIQWYFRCFEKNALNLMPKRTYVNNVGKDGTGVHYSQNGNLNDDSILDVAERGNLPSEIIVDEGYHNLLASVFLEASGGHIEQIKRKVGWAMKGHRMRKSSDPIA